jgi:heat shock protein HslJ
MRGHRAALTATLALLTCGCATTPSWKSLVGAWDVVRINDVPTAGDRFRLTFSQGSFEGYLGCNRVRGVYAVRSGRFEPGLWGFTQAGCVELHQRRVPIMTLEQWGFRVLGSRPRMIWATQNRLTLRSEQGELELARR